MPESVNAAAVQTKSAMVAKEYRFSVVMYGGVSLAIYMNGVAQELLHMVRSTARTSWDDKNMQFRLHKKGDPLATDKNLLKSTEQIYRDLAYELNDPEVDDVRFIIDVISGTSAGGINGIFLAKALTDDALSFDVLQSLWINEGAFEKLLNDKATNKTTKLPDGGLPKSLLSSDRMYIILLKAMQAMKKDDYVPGQSLAREIDLFATTTDINGRVIPLRLADMLVWERKHKEDFHFKFSSKHNDFVEKNNPFLAFVARCTSSFPFAFEPMQLSKLTELQQTEAWPKGAEVNDTLLQGWEDEFFDKSEQISTGNNRTRPYGDGGYLNNAPFSYVVNMLGRHGSSFPTERKLIYVEPTPEHPEDTAIDDVRASQDGSNVPTALGNSYDALVKLPGYQPIHDDLQRVIERNRLVRKVTELSSVITTRIQQSRRDPVEGDEEAGTRLLDYDCIGEMSYLILRVYATTDALAAVMGEWFNFTKSSSFSYVLRCLVRAWREMRFDGIGDARAAGPELVNQYLNFLFGFDLDFGKRKYRYVREQINTFYSCSEEVKTKLKSGFGIVLDLQVGSAEKKDFQQALIRLKAPFDVASNLIADAHLRTRPKCPVMPEDVDRKELAASFAKLMAAVQQFEVDGRSSQLEGEREEDAGPQRTADQKVAGKTVIEYVLGIQSQNTANKNAVLPADVDDSYFPRALKVLQVDGLRSAIEETATKYAAIVTTALIASERHVAEQLEQIRGELPETRGAAAAMEIVSFFSAQFELFDVALFPLIYDTDVGTPESIGIVRVSPDDSTALFNHPGSQKLAGATLAHFGAFLDRSFRTNDILWGRLDGSERIIHSLLSASQLTPTQQRVRGQALIKDAQCVIVREFLEERQGELVSIVHEIAKSLKPTEADPDCQARMIHETVASTLSALPKQGFNDAILGFLTVDKILDCLREVPGKREPDRQTTLESMTRAIHIVGGMLEGLSDETKSVGGFLIRVSTAVWWLLEAAVPNGLTGHFFRKLFAMLFWFEAVMVVGGTFLNQAVQSLGLKLLALTLALWLSKDLLHRFLLYGRRHRRGPIVTLALAAAFLLPFLLLLIWSPTEIHDKARAKVIAIVQRS